MRTFSARHWFGQMMSFLSFRVSRAGVFCDLSAVPHKRDCPLRIFPQAGAAVSPTDESQKHGALPPVTTEKTPLCPFFDIGYLMYFLVTYKYILSLATEKAGKEEEHPIKLYYKDPPITRHHKPKPMSGTKVSPYNHVSGSLQSR